MQKNQSSKLFRTPFSTEYWKLAMQDSKSVRMITVAALLIALRIVLKNFHIPIGQGMDIYFGYMLNAMGAMIYGPVMGILTGFVVDILGFVLFPSPYGFFFGYTITAMAGSFIYALFFYRTKITVLKIALAKISVNVLVNIGLGALWSSMLYGKGYFYYLAKSVVKNVVMLPVEIFLLYFFLQLMIPILTRMQLIPKQPAAKIPLFRYKENTQK
jgi:ECF transporter S component (folate family)